MLVCENPSVAEAAADALGVDCPPLVCLYGRPSGAAWEVISAAAAAGARLLVSTDRDVAGRQIAAEVTGALGARFGPGCVSPWLPDVEGMFEEERLDALLADLAARADRTLHRDADSPRVWCVHLDWRPAHPAQRGRDGVRWGVGR